MTFETSGVEIFGETEGVHGEIAPWKNDKKEGVLVNC
jgi:hypothetical protein